MTLNEMVQRFQTILNRDDCTTDAAIIYLQDSMSRVERDSRLPNMERGKIIKVLDEALTFIAIPPDLIEVIDVFVQNLPNGAQPRALDMISQRQMLRVSSAGLPTVYSRFQGQLNIRGSVPKGAEVVLGYYGEFSPFTTIDSANEISSSNPDLCIYGALSFAGDVFSHPSTDRWEARYQQILGQVVNLANDLDAKGGPSAIAPMYSE